MKTEDPGLPVLLKRFHSQDGTFSCCLKDVEHGTVLEFEGRSSVGPETVEILRQVIKTSGNEKETGIRSICVLFKVPNPAEGAFYEQYKLCCRLLIRYSNNLGDGLPIKKQNPFDTYVFHELPEVHEAWSPKDFYESVHAPVKCNDSAKDSMLEPLKTDLHCQLYPFQKRAVTWLLRREGVGVAEQDAKNESFGKNLPHGFKRTSDADGKQALVSRCLNIAIRDEKQLEDYASNVKGGILSEEMGLGKTVELVALMCLHKWEEPISPISTTPPDDSLKRSRATVIITPPAILRQWESELQTLAPHLKVAIYEGVHKGRKGRSNDDLVAQLLDQDVILTTYHVLARELHYTPAALPTRNMRHAQKYEQKRSPLTQILWWRVVLDEAQMIESGVSNAAKVAQLLPREHAWAVSGTPVKKDSKDLLGLLIFLQYQPYSASVKLWERMISNHREVFRGIIRNLALRHTKDQIKDELQLPPQTRMIINVPFTQIEEQHYSDMYQAMCDDCGLNIDGSPVKEDWDPNSPAVIEKMRTWLARLRQTCLHPQVGRKNRRAFGANKGPLRTVDEVLAVMTEQNETASRAEERALMLSRIRKGQILEHAKHTHEALRIWKDALKEAKALVADSRQQLSAETIKLGLTDRPMHLDDASESEDSPTARSGVYRHRLRSTLELEHMCTFFVANAYYQIKSNPELTEPDSATYKEFEKAEESTYELAKLLRQEILAEALNKANAWMNKIRVKARDRDLVNLPYIKQFENDGGIESRDLLARLHNLCDQLNVQKTHLEGWRQKLMELVLLPLVDEEDTDLQGDEYETSTKQQDEVYVYMDGLRAIVADRQDALLGQTNNRIDSEMKTAMKQAREGEGHAPALMKQLLSTRAKLKVDRHTGSIRGIITELRELKTNLRAQLDRGSVRAGAELMLVNGTLETLQDVSNEQTKVSHSLEKELELLKSTVDSRLEYYRQLQHISDTVAPYEEEMNDEILARTIANMEKTETEIRNRVATLKSRGRYLIHLRDEASSVESERHCIICREQFEKGVLTSCGHSYCVDCARMWWKTHQNCPTCKRGLSQNDFHQIT